MAYKLCPKCELNYITDNEEVCNICLNETYGIKIPETQNHSKTANKYFNEEFTFTSVKKKYRGKVGFAAYNSANEEVGIVYMTDDKRSPSYECCELCMYEKYFNKYGEWHRFTSRGAKIKWYHLCEILNKCNSVKFFID
jgi:hypothetical protein